MSCCVTPQSNTPLFIQPHQTKHRLHRGLSRFLGLGSRPLAVHSVESEASEHQHGTDPLAAGKLVAKVNDGGHHREKLARRRHDRAGQSSVLGDHSEYEKLRFKDRVRKNYIIKCYVIIPGRVRLQQRTSSSPTEQTGGAG